MKIIKTINYNSTNLKINGNLSNMIQIFFLNFSLMNNKNDKMNQHFIWLKFIRCRV
jgi:hypothetical protein